MTPLNAINVFSEFVLELHERGGSQDPVALFQWSLERLGRAIGADCAWGGWADLTRPDIDLCASVSHHLPDDFDSFWKQIRHEDLLARDVMKSGCDVAYYDRRGLRHTDGMIALSDRYHIDQMAVVTADQPGSTVSIFMSLYRGGPWARPVDAEETTLLRNALNHIRHLVLRDKQQDEARLLVNAAGRVLSASVGARAFIRDRWSDWNGEFAPSELTASPSPLLTRRFSALDLSVNRRILTQRSGQTLFGITLRPASLYDLLTARERQIAEEIAEGLTHKEIAKLLALSPATVRNHTQAILGKLNVHSKGALARMIRQASLN
jgi:DNA-binding CsgD family transcriptional regulator